MWWLFAIFGLIGLIKGEFKLTHNRKIGGQHGRIIGGVLLLVAIFEVAVLSSLLIDAAVLIAVIVVGFFIAEKTGAAVTPAESS